MTTPSAHAATTPQSRRAFMWTVVKYLLLAAGAFAMVAPFADMFLGSIRTVPERLAQPPVYWPRHPEWHNFVRAFTELPMLRWIGNSLLVTGVITLLQLITSSLAGYALAKLQFKGRGVLIRAVVGAQMFPFFLFLIPIFFILRFWPLAGGNSLLGEGGSGLLNSYLALILPFAVSWYGIFLMRQFMLSVPDELLDAARVDGAGEFRIFFRIALPLAKSALATLGIFAFVYQWNEVLWTMTVTRTAPNLQTLPVGIYLVRGAFADQRTYSVQQASLAISVVPVLLLFLALQRFYVRGITAGGVKG